MAHPSIVNYIVSEVQKGTPHDAIVASLLSEGGWKPSEIAEGFASIGLEVPKSALKGEPSFLARRAAVYIIFGLVIIGVVGALAWYAYSISRSPEAVFKKSLSKILLSDAYAFNLSGTVEASGPSSAFPNFLSKGDSLREIVNVNFRWTGSAGISDNGSAKVSGILRADIASSRFSAGQKISGEASIFYEEPLVYATIPFETAVVFAPEDTKPLLKKDQAVSVAIDAAKVLGRTPRLSLEERKKLGELFAEYAPIEAEFRGFSASGPENLRRYSYNINPYALKFVLRDFQKAFPERLSEESLRKAEKIIDETVFEKGEILITERSEEVRRINVTVSFTEPNSFNLSGTIKFSLIFSNFEDKSATEKPSGAILLSI